MTKMAAMPIYGKKCQQSREADDLETSSLLLRTPAHNSLYK